MTAIAGYGLFEFMIWLYKEVCTHPLNVCTSEESYTEEECGLDDDFIVSCDDVTKKRCLAWKTLPAGTLVNGSCVRP